MNMGRGLDMLRIDEELPELDQGQQAETHAVGFRLLACSPNEQSEGTTRIQRCASSRTHRGGCVRKSRRPIFFRGKSMSTWGLIGQGRFTSSTAQKRPSAIQRIPRLRASAFVPSSPIAAGTRRTGRITASGFLNAPTPRIANCGNISTTRKASTSSGRTNKSLPNLSVRFDRPCKISVRQNIKVVIYLVPLPGKPIEIMKRPEFSQYIASVKNNLANIATETGIEFFDVS